LTIPSTFHYVVGVAGELKRRSTGPTSSMAAPKAASTKQSGGGNVTRFARQERSVARISQLLNAAARVYDNVGLDNATMTDVAAAADTSIGTLYHWFPDKEALTRALSEQMLGEFMSSLEPLLVDRPEEHTYELVAKVMGQIAVFTLKHPVFAVLLDADPVSGSRMHEALAHSAQVLVELRVPGIDAAERDLAADTVVAMCRQMLAAFNRWPKKDRGLIVEEYRFLLMAYLLAKYPAADSPSWSVAPPQLRPSRTARSPRLLG
jgi:AcrR family transcriptional regulator